MRQITALEFDESNTNFHVILLWDNEHHSLQGTIKDTGDGGPVCIFENPEGLFYPVLVSGEERFVFLRVIVGVYRGKSVELPFNLDIASLNSWFEEPSS